VFFNVTNWCTKAQCIVRLILKIYSNTNNTALDRILDEANTIHLKIVPSLEVPGPVHGHDVPVLTFYPKEYHHHQWDLCTQQVAI